MMLVMCDIDTLNFGRNLDRGVVEKVRHRLAVVCTADGLGDGRGDVDDADLGAL